MAFITFLDTVAGRILRISAGLMLLAYGALSPTLPGIVAMMAGIAATITGFTRLPHARPHVAAPRETPR